MFYTGQNTLLSGVVVSAFAFFDFGDSHLSAFIVKQIAIIYSVGFAFAALVGRIAVVELRTLGSSGAKAGGAAVGLSTSQSGSKIGAAHSPTPSSTAVQDGKSGTIKATLPVKKLNSLMSTWIRHHVGLHVNDGYLSLVPAREDPELGVVLRLQHIQFDSSGAFENCLEVSTKGKAWVIQFANAEDRDKWAGMLQSTSASRRGGGQTSSTGAGATSRKGMLQKAPSNGNVI
ncbi:hypothetical protein BCR44DRAFT_1429423 [Catenaria anguillulae PL171]|uniref:PH domain-containing protein n=1 Tax=Catenaria anguillulae PL171 TaxID=765915 RepID=A0A1Y2HTU5_9FUNG|nr:hypothetical protein BCR44DRAFT_1429423 [Catenaria anguillulae PL171]